jgi:hypothetical protein
LEVTEIEAEEPEVSMVFRRLSDEQQAVAIAQ